MNLADYLSELLEQQDEVSVPGLGCFVRVHVNGYYSETEARFHPPYHQVKFTPQPKDDDTFTQYVAEKKNISLASSKYFAEKFVSNLNEQAAKGNYLFADIGLFRNEQGQLTFKPNERITPDPSFYGLPIVSLHKIGAEQTQFFDEPKAIAAYTPPVNHEPVKDEYFEDELETKKPVSIWIIIAITVGVLALGIFGLKKFYPAVFNKIGDTYHHVTGKNNAKSPVIAVNKKTHDTVVKKQVVTEDSIAKIVAPPVDAIPVERFEIIAGSFKSLPKANIMVATFAKHGITAKVLTDAPGPLLKISVGTFTNRTDAEAKKAELVKAGKIKRNSYTQKLNPLK